MVNRYPAPCSICGGTVPASGGKLERQGNRWNVTHLACAEGGKVNVFWIGGRSYTQNVNGRCIDAPCCGCCDM